jgi:hypothetical protein
LPAESGEATIASKVKSSKGVLSEIAPTVATSDFQPNTYFGTTAHKPPHGNQSVGCVASNRLSLTPTDRSERGIISMKRSASGSVFLELARKIARRVPIGFFPKHYVPKTPVQGRPSILVIGIYMGLEPNHSIHIIEEFNSAKLVDVEQRWVCMLGQAPNANVAAATVRQLDKCTPKWQLVNELIKPQDFDRFDYFIICDDDVLFGPRFIDNFIAEQQSLDFALAQPARTWRSITDHAIVRRRLFTRARQTNFVEIGPVVSFRRDFLKAVYPFSMESPMGWGYDLAWPVIARELDVPIGIIDRVPVDHSLRPPAALYNASQHFDLMTSYLSKRPHMAWTEALRTLRTFR